MVSECHCLFRISGRCRNKTAQCSPRRSPQEFALVYSRMDSSRTDCAKFCGIFCSGLEQYRIKAIPSKDYLFDYRNKCGCSREATALTNHERRSSDVMGSA